MESKNHNNNAVGEGSHEEQLAGPADNGAEVREIPIEKIKVGEFCRRSTYDDIEPLAESIKQNGLLQPGAVIENKEGSYTLIYGSRRFEAHKLLSKKTFRCRVIKATTEQAAILSFAENSATEKMGPVEQARKLRLMMKTFGWKEKYIARRIGWKQSSVSEYIGILDLGEDILAKIDTRPEGSFRYTHALTLSKLNRSGRVNAEIEVEELLNKTINHSLPCSELKALVHLFRKRLYDRLPDQLRTYLLKEKGMTSALAMLYLEPASIIEGKGNATDRRRHVARNLPKKQFESLILKAVKARWTFDRTRQKLLGLIECQSESVGQKKDNPKSSFEKLIDDISVISNRLKVCSNEVSDLARSNPVQLKMLSNEIDRLTNKLTAFGETFLAKLPIFAIITNSYTIKLTEDNPR